MQTKVQITLISVFFIFCFATCKKSTNNNSNITPSITYDSKITQWITNANQNMLLQQQTLPIAFNGSDNGNPVITVDSTQLYQSIDGFGFSLTGGSAQLINAMSAIEKANLLQELFGNNSNSIGISYLRISLGASDLNAQSFTYNDMPAGQIDIPLNNFSLAADNVTGTGLIPLLKEILLINPQIKILASPWSAPTWMKSNNSFIGGSLQTQYYTSYANYFVKYIQQMAALGIKIDAITIQNEPENPNNYPSMVMTNLETINFVKNNLGPAFTTANLSTKIIIYDHNCDHPNYPISVLDDAAAKAFIDGSAFHLYAGNIAALTTLHNAYPTKNIYFTEQWTGSTSSFDGDFVWHIKNVIIGSMQNWSKNALEWNLANDPFFNPHTPGGCTECKGALTISGSNITRNVSYYIIAQISKFVPVGSVRIQSNSIANMNTVAFLTPNGNKVLLILNDASNTQNLNIKYKGFFAPVSIAANTAVTYIWK